MTKQNGSTLGSASERVCAEEYTVQRGDSVYSFSQKLDVPLRDLLAANRDIHPARLMVGDVLCIPREEDDAPETGGLDQPATEGGNTPVLDNNTVCPVENRVTLTEGVTVADIQLQNQLNRTTLQSANPTLDLAARQVGQVLCVPTVNQPCALPETYTLQTGDTLETVAVKFNLPIASLLRANPCLAPRDFEEGLTIVMPR